MIKRLFVLILIGMVSLFLITCVKKDTGKIARFISVPNPFNDANIAANQVKFKIDVNGIISFNYKIEIFAENGNVVSVLQGTGAPLDVPWMGTDDRGNKVNNGVYTSLLTLEEVVSGHVAGTYQAFCYTVKN